MIFQTSSWRIGVEEKQKKNKDDPELDDDYRDQGSRRCEMFGSSTVI